MTADRMTGVNKRHLTAFLFVSVSLLALVGCQTGNPEDVISIDRAQGSEGNITSLTQVIRNNPSAPQAYNVRGSAYGKAGDFNQALKDFNRAIALNPKFYQPTPIEL